MIEEGAYLNLGAHHLGRFPEKCADCGEDAPHRFTGATFGGTAYLCPSHASLYLLREAEACGTDFLLKHLASYGYIAR